MSKKKQEEIEDNVNTENPNNTATEESKEERAEDANEVSTLKADLAELNDKYLRLYSEFDNFKRRTARERIELMQSASREVILAMLPVLDDFERAEKSMEASTDIEAVKEGVKLIQHKMKSVLTQSGLQALDSIGKDFDVDFHEAVTKIPAPTEELKGKVVDEVERGYLLKDKVIRFAKVIVGE
ncbi:MAG: nucleotide exchange factor GrpE [Bacteroidetes bacterium]|nr:nucleotide exchange factor GrpE [Bacteroidota bacterium]